MMFIYRFSVRPPTYYQKCREQQWYLSKVELESSIILQQFEELKQVNYIHIVIYFLSLR